MKTCTAVIEKCPGTGLYVGFVPGFPGSHSQAETPGGCPRIEILKFRPHYIAVNRDMIHS
jgi:hypothetical protein